MKIGFDGRFIRQLQSGDGVFSQHLIEGLARLDRDNEYTVYLLEDNAFIRRGNFCLKRMPTIHASAHLRFLLSFPWELIRNRVDVFHAIHTIPIETFCRVVLHLVEFGWITNPEEFPASRIVLFQLRQIIHHSIRRADRIITATEFWKRKLVDYFSLSEEKVAVIPHGYDERFLARCDPEDISKVRRKYGIRGDFLLAVGDLHPRKNLIRLIDTFTWLKESKKIPHQLVLVGKALYQAEEVFRKAHASSARDALIFTGYVPLEELRALYQGAAVFVFPSLDEGFGLPVLEAMASRVPVVVSNRGALPEVAGESAIVVDPLDIEDMGSAICDIIDDDRLQEELIAKGTAQLGSFSWDHSCRKVLNLYETLYSEHTGRQGNL
jgi:glycosyltransferase involved in cell wall biosynthesis